MTRLRLEPVGPKHLVLRGINALVADCLQRLPEILAARDHPAANKRLFAPPSADRTLNAEWEQFVAPDLRHLFVTAGETVARDLTALTPDPKSHGVFRVEFPCDHVAAWLNAVNQARLILGANWQVVESDMERTDLDPRQPRDLALLQIHVLGYVLQQFIECEAGGAA